MTTSDLLVGADKVLWNCSFCGKSQREVKILIAGNAAYICDRCVDICLDIIAEHFGDARTSSLLDQAGLPQSFPTADGEVTREMMAAACEALAGAADGLTSLELARILDLQDPGHENRVWRPGSDRRVNQLLIKFNKKGLIEYRKGSAGVFRWFL